MIAFLLPKNSYTIGVIQNFSLQEYKLLVIVCKCLLVGEMVKNPPEMQAPRILSLGWENPLEKGTAIHSSILAWGIPWTEAPDRLQSMGLQSQTKMRPNTHTDTHWGNEGKGRGLQRNTKITLAKNYQTLRDCISDTEPIKIQFRYNFLGTSVTEKQTRFHFPATVVLMK